MTPSRTGFAATVTAIRNNRVSELLNALRREEATLNGARPTVLGVTPHRPTLPPLDGLEETAHGRVRPDARRRRVPAASGVTARRGAPIAAPRPRPARHGAAPQPARHRARLRRGCELVDAHVRAAFWDKAPDWIGTDPADLERPHVEVGIPAAGGDVQLYLNPGQARSFAAALVRAADAADTEAFYRPPVTARHDLGRCARQYAVAPGLMPRHRSAWMGHGCPTAGHPP